MVVAAGQRKRHGVPRAQHVRAGHGLAAAIAPQLVGVGALLHHGAHAGGHLQGTAFQLKAVLPIVAQANAGGIGAGGQFKVVFHLIFAAVQAQVGAGVQGPVAHGAVGGHVAGPLLRVVAQEKVGVGTALLFALHRSQGIGAHKSHRIRMGLNRLVGAGGAVVHGLHGGGVVQGLHQAARRQKQAPAGHIGREQHRPLPLVAVGQEFYVAIDGRRSNVGRKPGQGGQGGQQQATQKDRFAHKD